MRKEKVCFKWEFQCLTIPHDKPKLQRTLFSLSERKLFFFLLVYCPPEVINLSNIIAKFFFVFTTKKKLFGPNLCCCCYCSNGAASCKNHNYFVSRIIESKTKIKKKKLKKFENFYYLSMKVIPTIQNFSIGIVFSTKF